MSVDDLRAKCVEYKLLDPSMDVTDEDILLMRDVLESEMPQPCSNETILSSLVAIDGIPVVDDKRHDKLLDVLTKKFSKVTEGTKQDPVVTRFELSKADIQMPKGDDGKTKGFCFVKYKSQEEAEKAAKLINNTPLDTKHIFKTILLSQIEKYSRISEEFITPEAPSNEETADLQSWLSNKLCLDQFAMYHGESVEVFWNGKNQAQSIIERNNWTQHYISWSPQGRYLATIHQQGIALWGGENWEKIQRFQHVGVKLLDFSPCERFMCTWSSEIQDNREDPDTIIIWDVRSGEKLRGFIAGTDQLAWPVFKWSHDGAYVARAADDFISVFDTKTMKTIDKGERKSIKVPQLKDFAWSPSDNMLTYWVPERGHLPARVVLLDMPSRTEMRSKNLFNVRNCMIHWQQNGDFLCVKVDSFDKQKKPFTGFELFRIRDKGVPVDNIEIQEQVHAFSWEPVNNKFVIIHGEAPATSMSVYAMKYSKDLGAHVKLLHCAEKKSFNTIFWSPRGNNFIIANLRGSNRSFEFWEVNPNTEAVSFLGQGEHYMGTHVEWDPTGRYLMTAVSAWNQPTEHGYHIWTSQGRLLQRVTVNKMYQILWRPRPKTLLTKNDLKQVGKKLKGYAAQFEKEDREAAFNISSAERAIRQEQLSVWESILAKIVACKGAEDKELVDQYQAEYDAQGWFENEVEVDILQSEKAVNIS